MSRQARFALMLITGLLLAVAVWEASIVVPQSLATGNVGLDLNIYLDRTRDWLAGDGFYRLRQLSGPYAIEHGDSLYPPNVLLLLVPMTVLPGVLCGLCPSA